MLIATKGSKINISKEKNLAKFASKLSKFTQKGDTIFLYGNLGVGKTTFVKYFVNYTQKKNKLKITEVPSPTFNIVYNYQIKDYEILHFDLYRLKNKNECKNIGLFEEMENIVTIIEWPEKAIIKPQNRIDIKFNYSKNFRSRFLKISYFGRCKNYV